MEYLGAVSVDAYAGHPNDIAYPDFKQLMLPKSMVEDHVITNCVAVVVMPISGK
jgi:hypothetical protein